MSDYVHDDRRSRDLIDHRTLESRTLYGAFFTLFLTRAALKRTMSRYARTNSRVEGARDTIFSEARTAASVMVASSFTGL